MSLNWQIDIICSKNLIPGLLPRWGTWGRSRLEGRCSGGGRGAEHQGLSSEQPKSWVLGFLLIFTVWTKSSYLGLQQNDPVLWEGCQRCCHVPVFPLPHLLLQDQLLLLLLPHLEHLHPLHLLLLPLLVQHPKQPYPHAGSSPWERDRTTGGQV